MQQSASMVVDDELNELKRIFLDEARQKVTDMESAFERATDEALERVSYLAHQLKGAGGSYGYQRISAEAEALENALEQRAKGSEAREYLSRLRSEIEARAREI